MLQNKKFPRQNKNISFYAFATLGLRFIVYLA